MRKTFYEIFTEVEKCKTKKEKIAKLRENSSAAMRATYWVIHMIPWCKMAFTRRSAIQAAADGVDVQGQFVSELRKLYLFIDGTLRHRET